MIFAIPFILCFYLSTYTYAYQEPEHIVGEYGGAYTIQELKQLAPSRTQQYQYHHHLIAQRNFDIPDKNIKYNPMITKASVVQSVAINTLATTLAECRAFPPDTMGDVGPTQYIVACNGRVKTLSKITGLYDGVLNLDLGDFFSLVSAGQPTSDPRIRYDRMTDRWFLICINVDEPNRVLLAMSDSGIITPATLFHFFFFDQSLVPPTGQGTCLADYPTLGIDANGIYIGVNEFCLDTSGSSTATHHNVHTDGQLEENDDNSDQSFVFVGSTGFVIQKAPLINNNILNAFAFRDLIDEFGDGPYTPQGVDNVDANPTYGYFIGVNASTFSQLSLVYIADVTTTPHIVSTTVFDVPSTTSPILVPHKGNNRSFAGYLDSIDDRLMYAHIRNGHLWTCHNIGVNNQGLARNVTRNGCRWYEIDITSFNNPVVKQVGTVFTQSSNNDFNQRHYWMPSLIPTGQGHMILGCSTAGTNEFANAAFTSHLQSDLSGTIRTPVLYTNATTAYNPDFDPGGSGGRRWGDYSSVRLDPVDDMTVWTVQEYCNSTNSYGVRLAKIVAPALPSLLSASPSKIDRNKSSVTVTITGDTSNGKGFFDPGNGFANRLRAMVSGGVTVTAVQYINRSKIKLTLSTVGASSGSKTVTIINPDGQSITRTNVIKVK